MIRSEEVLRIERFYRRELPRLVREELERRLLGSMSPVENELRSQMVDIVRDCQALAFRHYHRQGNPEAEGPVGDEVPAFSLPPPPPDGGPTVPAAAGQCRNRDSFTHSSSSVNDSGYASISHSQLPEFRSSTGSNSATNHGGHQNGYDLFAEAFEFGDFPWHSDYEFDQNPPPA